MKEIERWITPSAWCVLQNWNLRGYKRRGYERRGYKNILEVSSRDQQVYKLRGEGCTWHPKLTPRRLFCLSTRPFLTTVRFFLQYNPVLAAKITKIAGKSVSLAILVPLWYSQLFEHDHCVKRAFFEIGVLSMNVRLPFPFHPSLEFNTDLGPGVTISGISNRFSNYFFHYCLRLLFLFIIIIILY